MNNVISVTRTASTITIQYNVSYGGGKSFVGSGGVDYMPYCETINYSTEEDAQDLFIQLTGSEPERLA